MIVVLILRLDNLVKCCDLILLMLAYSFVLLELENRRGKRILLYVWSVKRMKRRRKRKRNSGGRRRKREEEEKVGDLNGIGRSRDGVAYGYWVSRHVGSRRWNPLLRERLLDLPSLESLAWSGSRVLHMSNILFFD